MKKIILALVLVVSSSSIGALASEKDPTLHDLSLGAFFGGRSQGSSAYFSFGADLEWRLHIGAEDARNVGVGPIVDITTATPSAITFLGAGVFVHPWKGLKVIGAPGIELTGGTSNADLRVGTTYDFEINSNITLGPLFYADFLSAYQAYRYGVRFGFGF